ALALSIRWDAARCSLLMPSTSEADSAAVAPHRKKAARALHRTAFHTTADFAVPPLYLIHNRRKRKWLRSSPTILECNDEIGPLGDRGDGHARTRPLKL